MKEQRLAGAAGRGIFDRLIHALGGEPKNRTELVQMLRDAQSRELLGSDALAMIEGVFQVADMQVRDIMIPRSHMVVVDEDSTLSDMLPVIIESGHSRFPVIADSRDEVAGVLLAKDLLRYSAEAERASFNLNDVTRPAIFIPESKRLNTLLKEFRSSRNHMAIVVDEYGGVAGLVTIEDVLEQIVGDIGDEHDVEEDLNIREHADQHYTVRALTPIEEFNQFFGTSYSDEEFDTIGGMVMGAMGQVPRTGETMDLGRLVFKVLAADSRRIHLLQVVRFPDSRNGQADAE